MAKTLDAKKISKGRRRHYDGQHRGGDFDRLVWVRGKTNPFLITRSDPPPGPTAQGKRPAERGHAQDGRQTTRKRKETHNQE